MHGQQNSIATHGTNTNRAATNQIRTGTIVDPVMNETILNPDLSIESVSSWANRQNHMIRRPKFHWEIVLRHNPANGHSQLTAGDRDIL